MNWNFFLGHVGNVGHAVSGLYYQHKSRSYHPPARFESVYTETVSQGIFPNKFNTTCFCVTPKNARDGAENFLSNSDINGSPIVTDSLQMAAFDIANDCFAIRKSKPLGIVTPNRCLVFS